MGALSSKSEDKVKHWSWSGPPGEHSPFPTDPAPYPGYPIKYCFLDFTARYKVMDCRVNFGPTAVATNIEEYLHEIRACYAEGYRLQAFLRVPGLKTSVEVADWTMQTPYQAILSKPDKQFQDKDSGCDLHLEKKVLSTKLMHFDSFDDENSLVVTIKKYAEKGGRLVCTEPVGYLRSNTTNTQYGAIGVEMFFQIPTSDSAPPAYTYHTVKIPARYRIDMDATQRIQQIICEADFNKQLKLFLDQGWKLVDICMDNIALAEAFRTKAKVRYVDTLWIFEKEQAHLDDVTPRYEGVIIEYLHKVKNTIHGDYPCRDWRPVVAGMGVMGWQLAAILQTPAIVQTSFTVYAIKLIMIFQRRLLPSFDRYRSQQRAAATAASKTSTSQSRTGQSRKKTHTEDVFVATGQDAESSVYYNETLKKYIYTSALPNGSVSFNRVRMQTETTQPGHNHATLPRAAASNSTGRNVTSGLGNGKFHEVT